MRRAQHRSSGVFRGSSGYVVNKWLLSTPTAYVDWIEQPDPSGELVHGYYYPFDSCVSLRLRPRQKLTKGTVELNGGTYKVKNMQKHGEVLKTCVSVEVQVGGIALAKALANEYDLVIVDNDSRAVANAQSLDCLVVNGNITSREIMEAGVASASMFIADAFG